jgi:hypothetical protein
MSKIQDDAYSEAMDEIARSKAALSRNWWWKLLSGNEFQIK